MKYFYSKIKMLTKIVLIAGASLLGFTATAKTTFATGDQIIAFHGGNGVVSGTGAYCIATINNFYYPGGGTTTAGWNVAVPAGTNSSLMPPGLVGGISAFYTGAVLGSSVARSGKFNCTGTPTATAASVRSAVMTMGNWSFLASAGTTTYSGCQFIASNPVITGNPPSRTICSGGNTTFSITATGAASYQWYQNTGTGFTALSNGATFSGVKTSTLTITGATAAMSGYQYRCIAYNSSGSATSNSATLTVFSISATTTKTNVSCNNGSNGTATVTASGGLPPYTYSWAPYGGTAATATGLGAGVYTVTITDNLGCSTTATATITQPTAISGTTMLTDIACNGSLTGAINLTPTGGTAPYTFDWGEGITTEDRTGLAAGTYTVAITDAKGCTGAVSATITQPTVMSATTSQTNISCYGGSNGAASITVTGGTAPYTYLWSPSGGTAAATTGLAAGTYIVTVKDANACTMMRTVTITEPTALSATTSRTNISCYGGSNGTASITVTGGTKPYTYSWSPSGSTDASATGLPAGTYTINVTDASACTLSKTVTVTQPAMAVSGTSVVTNIACNGGSTGAIDLTPLGGTAPYTFYWGEGLTTEDRMGLAAGTYSVTITDANGCVGVVGATVTQPAAVSAPTGEATQSFNSGESLSSLAVSGQNIKWYLSALDASNHTGSLPMNTPIVNNTVYYATQTVGECESTVSLAVLAFNSSLGASNVTRASEMQINPNPVIDILNISGEENITKLVIYTADGRKVIEKMPSKNERSINVRSLVQGVYLIQIFNQNNVKTFKFIKR